MFQFHDSKYGYLSLVPVLKGTPVKAGKVLLARRKKSGKFVTESYDLSELRNQIPEKVLREYGYHVEEKTVYNGISTKTVGGRELVFIPSSIDPATLEPFITNEMGVEDLKRVIESALIGKLH